MRDFSGTWDAHLPARVQRGPVESRRIRQRVETRDEVTLLFRPKLERRGRKRLTRNATAQSRRTAAVVEVDDLLERLEPAVVHVGRSARDVAERGHLDRELVVRHTLD